MRPLLLAVALVTVVAIVGFEPSIGPTFRTTFPENPGRDEGTVDLSALPVILYDFTGLVTTVDAVKPNPGQAFYNRVAQVDGDPMAIRIDWVGGACESRVTVLVFDAGDPYGLTVRSSGKLGIPGCPAVGIPRSLMVRFKQPIPLYQFRLKGPFVD